MAKKPIVAISGCLVGEEIRYNGQHKRNPFVVHEFSKYFEFKNFCPEVAMGLGIPRETIRLVNKSGEVRLVNSKDFDIDHTENAHKTFKKMEKDLKDVCGIVFASKSPSCGYDPINVVDYKNKNSVARSRGLFADHIEKLYPLIPKINSGRLYDEEQRITFRTQVQVYQDFMTNIHTPNDLIKFHETYKYYLMQYGAVHLKSLGRICAGVTKKSLKEKMSEYSTYLFIKTFKKKITSKNRTNVAEHMAGYFKRELSSSDKKYLHDNIKLYHEGKIEYETLLTLIGFLTQSYKQKYLKSQQIFKLYRK